MIFSTIVILLILAIGFFHYLQGFISSTLSAICAILAAGLALSFHEPLVGALLRGKFADEAHAIALVVLFAAIYTLLRIAFDSMVPGNVRLPAIADKIGGGAMGIIAGIFATGVMAIAGQTLPFGPSIAQHTPYAVNDERGVAVGGRRGGRMIDMTVRDELRSDTFASEDEQGLIIPVDRVVLGMVSHLSDGGALAGARPLGSVHPDYVQELFGNRLGVQVGAKHTAMSLAAVEGPFTVDSLMQIDAEISNIRTRELPTKIDPPDDQMLLIARVIFDKNSSDKDWLFRFSPGSVRLVANGVNYYPIGTLEGASHLKSNRIDDFLFVNLKETDKGADLVFLVNKEDVLSSPEVGAASDLQIAPGVFLEVKRLAREDLSGTAVTRGITPSERVEVLRKGAPPQQQPRPRRAAPGAPPAQPLPGTAGMMPPQPTPPPGPAGVPMDPNGLPSAR